MGGNVFSIGISGLNAARAGLVTTGHNIANVSTEGYTRQNVVLSTNVPQFTGQGYVGSGVNVQTVQRQFSQFLHNQRLAAETQQSYLETFDTQASQIDNLLADPASGLSPALQDFFSGVQEVAANPSSVPARQSMLSLSESMVARIETLDARFTQLREGLNTEIEGAVFRINSLATQVAELNARIISSEGPESQPPNDLLDQRDTLVSELNQYVRVTAVPQSDGSMNVSIGSGQSLVVGTTTLEMVTGPSESDPSNYEVRLVAGTAEVPLPTSVFEGGKLGGLFAFRDNLLDQAQNAFGRVAMVLAHTFNEQHRLGQDLNGSLGQDFFDAPSPTVQARTTNAGDGVVTATLADVDALGTSDYNVMYLGGNYIVTTLPSGSQSTYASLPQTIGGVTIALASGTPQDGDTFLVMPTRYAARDLSMNISDTALIAAAAPIRTASSLANAGNAKISAGTVTDVTGLPLATDVTLTYSAATNEISVSGATPSAGPFTYTAGSDITFNGITVSISGIPKDGDTFTLRNNTAGVADSRNANLLAQLQTAKTVAGGTASYQGAYSQIVADVGNQTREAQVQLIAQDALVRQTQAAEQSYSGVNLDEEAANLVRFQQAYQASGKVLEIASKLFEQLLALGV